MSCSFNTRAGVAVATQLLLAEVEKGTCMLLACRGSFQTAREVPACVLVSISKAWGLAGGPCAVWKALVVL